MNYDTNLVTGGRMAKQRVRLVFGWLEYRKTMEVDVGGNCTGLTVIRAAVNNAFEELPAESYAGDAWAYIVLGEGEKTCMVSDEDGDGEDWLADMLISAEIISIEPDNSP